MSEFADMGVHLIAVTEDGSGGRKGRATEVLQELLAAETSYALYACGPMPLLKAIGEIALERELPCQISVETAMPCGIGTCFGCAIPVRDPSASEGFLYARACFEGPVFEAKELIWGG
jgi:dihydroorotate dehydrogenase electron transfer subunit